MKKIILGLIFLLIFTTANAELSKDQISYIEDITLGSKNCLLELEDKGQSGYLNCTLLIKLVNRPEYLKVFIDIRDKVSKDQEEYVGGMISIFVYNSREIFKHIEEWKKIEKSRM